MRRSGTVRRALTALVAVAPVALAPISSATQRFFAPRTPKNARLAGLQSSLPAPLPPHTRLIGPARASLRLHVDITLRLGNPGGAASYISELSERGSADFGHFIGPAGFASSFGATDAEVAAVERALRAGGLEPGQVSVDHLDIPVVATVGELRHAFHIGIASYRLANGRTGFANTDPPLVPSSVAPYIEGVLGLSDLSLARPLLAPSFNGSPARPAIAAAPGVAAAPRRSGPPALAAGPPAGGAGGHSFAPSPCPAASRAAHDHAGYTANTLAQTYGLSGLYSLGDLGGGVSIGILELEPDSPGDIAAYQSCYGTHTAVRYHEVLGGAGTGSGGGEATLDIEDSIGLAPRSTVDVWQAPNNANDDEYLDLHAMVAAGVDQVISTSWGVCESFAGAALENSEQSVVEEAAVAGITVLAAAGDSGSEDCFGVEGTSELSVDDPASQPGVVGVGGTELTAHDEVVWNESFLDEGAGGGGVSMHWPMPHYQSQFGVLGVVNPNSSQTCAGSYCREVPDVSADADPRTGYVIYFTGDFNGSPFGGWGVIGGTSAAAPLWAASAAMVDSSPYCNAYDSGHPGTLPAGLYAIAGSRGFGGSFYGLAFRDITSGNNDYTPANGGAPGGLYGATAGYDMASGLGTPHFTNPSFFYPGIAADLCYYYVWANRVPHITGLIPSGNAPSRSTTVVIDGSGFMPVPGADRVYIGSTRLAGVSCISSTRCTAIVPPGPHPETVDLHIVVNELATSPSTPADQFIYTGPQGYWLAAGDGAVFAAGDARPFGRTAVAASDPVVAIRANSSGSGYWLATRAGGVRPFGTASYQSDLPARHVNVSDIVGIAPTGDGRGYWLVGRDGGLFAFGDARYHGSLPGLGIHIGDIVGVVATSNGGGYWMLGADGGVFAFGDARFVGSLPGIKVRVRDIVSMIPSEARNGYILVGSDGGTFAFGGGVHFFGSLPGEGIHVDDIVDLALAPGAHGYWLAGSDGTVYPFGDGETFARPAGLDSNLPVAGIAAT